MMSPFDIFRVQDDGHVMWIEAVASLQDAKKRVHTMILDSDSRFIVLNQVTGTRYHFPERPEWQSRTPGESGRPRRN
jgi:hypothetical protein